MARENDKAIDGGKKSQWLVHAVADASIVERIMGFIVPDVPFDEVKYTDGQEGKFQVDGQNLTH